MKTLSIVIVLVAVVGLMVYTNPTMNDFDTYIRQSVIKESEKQTRDSMGRFLGSIVGGLAGTVVTSQTVRSDYLIFSLYEARLGTEKLKALGICKNFILLESPKLK
ncbi:MAG: DUF4359 domain-containing protein [Syntrophobacteraceae bacterium]